MKPDWKHAPSWANYVAMDQLGYWYWYETIPAKHPTGEWWVAQEGRMCPAESPDINWKESLEARQ